ncbi:uncharacterized protein [Parasteatoda tepidariorum]|uniref:uncharacterized protein n=1 Tax=Parasteatoda tepidariorum TaxID=114398 RepID=UPI001C729CD2|nr:uncharacterized protein LOC122272216 [Parasteatoda tepidariorum]
MHPKFMKCLNIMLLLLGFLIPEIMGVHFMTKEIALAAIIGGLLKPRFVPLPIPIPLPITFSKHVRKPYPVHPYGYSAYGHQGDQFWQQASYDYPTYDSKASGTHALAELQSASENIDSILKQLSLSSSDIVKDSESVFVPSVHNSIEEYNTVDDYTNFSEDWWRK